MKGFLALKHRQICLEFYERHQTVAVAFGFKNMYANSVDFAQLLQNIYSLQTGRIIKEEIWRLWKVF